MSPRSTGHPDILGLAPVIPVVVLSEAEAAVPLARALVTGGLPAIEVTLRTPAGIPAIERIAAEVPEAVVGAGTVTRPEQARDAARAGADFLVSPGCTGRLRGALEETGLPHLPGVATASEVLALLEEGVTSMKFFPAAPAGGVAYLRSLASPLPEARFCPTGGVTPDNAGEYLGLPNVGCVGGTWLAPADAVAAGDWERIESLAREAARLG